MSPDMSPLWGHTNNLTGAPDVCADLKAKMHQIRPSGVCPRPLRELTAFPLYSWIKSGLLRFKVKRGRGNGREGEEGEGGKWRKGGERNWHRPTKLLGRSTRPPPLNGVITAYEYICMLWCYVNFEQLEFKFASSSLSNVNLWIV